MACFVATLGVGLLLALFNLSAANMDTCDLYASVGQSVTLPFVYKMGKSHILRWTHNDSIIFYMQEGKVSVGKPEDLSSAGSLWLRNLQVTSAGIYQVNVRHLNNTLARAWTTRLCMMDKVSKPQLSYVCDLKSNAVNLNCGVAKPQGVVFSWMLDKKALPSETKQTLSISLKQLKEESSFSCSVANKVSKESSDSVRPTCKAPPDLCFTRKTVTGALAGGAGLIFLFFLIVMVLCCRLRRNKSQMKLWGKREEMMFSTNKRAPDSISPDYETMHLAKDSPPPSPKLSPRVCYQNTPESEVHVESRPPHLSAAAEGQQPSPVPKPRIKNTQAQNM
ncbi:T-cell surface antigen CD2-like [Odontesthes bonariensis]|uniref:T-cell surface antigen CD2-like n=1 Tax=Odontesthes bonariensis TaxID=219752 RepID=UPI003F582CCF